MANVHFVVMSEDGDGFSLSCWKANAYNIFSLQGKFISKKI